MLTLAGRGSSVPGSARGSNGESPTGMGRGAGDKWPVASECGGDRGERKAPNKANLLLVLTFGI